MAEMNDTQIKTFTDGDLYVAMKECFNEDINIDPMDAMNLNEIQESETPLRWNGAIWNYDGMDIQNLKHPFFENTKK